MTKTQARVLLPNRGQMELRANDLESLLPEWHRVRLVWAYVERQDLTGFYEDIRAVEGGVGRSAIAPEILLGLWLYATLDGVGSAREIARLTAPTTPIAGCAVGCRCIITPCLTFARITAKRWTNC